MCINGKAWSYSAEPAWTWPAKWVFNSSFAKTISFSLPYGSIFCSVKTDSLCERCVWGFCLLQFLLVFEDLSFTFMKLCAVLQWSFSKGFSSHCLRCHTHCRYGNSVTTDHWWLCQILLPYSCHGKLRDVAMDTGISIAIQCVITCEDIPQNCMHSASFVTKVCLTIWTVQTHSKTYKCMQQGNACKYKNCSSPTNVNIDSTSSWHTFYAGTPPLPIRLNTPVVYSLWFSSHQVYVVKY